MKKFSISVLIFLISFFIFAEGSANQKKFVRGNIQDKISSLQVSKGEELSFLAIKAVDFSLENKEILGNDRDLNALAVAGVLSVPFSYIESLSDSEKNLLVEKFLVLYKSFIDENVKIAVLNKFASGLLPSADLTVLLNDLVIQEQITNSSPNFVKAVIYTLGAIGDGNTFLNLYDCYSKKSYSQYKPALEDAMISLSDNSYSQIVQIIHSGNIQDIQRIYDLIVKNEKKSQNFRAQIAENILSSTIYIAGEGSSLTQELVSLQVNSMKVMADCKWTRGAKTVVAFYNAALKEYESKKMQESDFVLTVAYAATTAPMDCVSLYSNYLMTLNREKEKGSQVSEDLVLAYINALGVIGDKNAFDSLLSVTYYNYSDNVITQARNALASLKW